MTKRNAQQAISEAKEDARQFDRNRWERCRYSRWKGPDLLRLKAAYLGPMTLEGICQRFHTSRGRVMKLAKQYDWPRRRRPYPQRSS